MTTNPAYPDSVAVQFFVDNAWFDVSAYVLGDIEGDWGILGNKPADKMGYIGGMTILLNNDSGLFVPGTIGSLNGFQKGTKARVVITYEDIPYVRFKGKISRIGLPYNVEEISVVPVSVSDWLRAASKQNIILQGVETNVKTAEAVEILLQKMVLQPDAVNLDYGSEILESVFTSTDPRSTVYSELGKLALTEFAYIYLRKDRVYGETLKVEHRHSRVSVPVTDFPKPKQDSDSLLLADSDSFLLSDGSELTLNETTHITFDNMYQAELEYGEHLINELTVRHNPTRVDNSLSVLFSLNAPIYIAAGQTLLDFKVSYKDPTGGSGRINGSNMQPPVPVTDYRMFVNPNGTGADLTASLSFTVEYGSSGAVYKSMTNTGAIGGWLTVLQARGFAVFIDQPVEKVLSDQASIDANELSTYSINNQYQSDPNITETIATSVLSLNKDNKTVPQKIKLCANLSPYMMLAFLNLDIGHLIPAREDKHLIDTKYFIQSVKFKITPGKIIPFEWGLVEAPFADNVFWELEIDGKTELEETTFISF